MKDWKHPLLRSRMEHFRIGILLVLGITCIGLLAGAGVQPQVQGTASGAQPLDGLTVALDPGHGGYDGGARAHDSGIWEKEINLQIALAVEKELTARGAQVTLTRREDICLAPGDTATKARRPAVFVIRPCVHTTPLGFIHASTYVFKPLLAHIFGLQTATSVHEETADAHIVHEPHLSQGLGYIEFFVP